MSPRHTTILDEDLRHIMANAPVGMVVSQLDGTFVYANPALMHMLGYQDDEIYASDVIISHPDDYALNHSIREQQVVNPNKPFIVEKRYPHKKGHSILGLASFVCVDNKNTGNHYIVAQIINITEQKKSKNQ